MVQIDGMGSNWRSKAFHDVCWRDLADAGLPDRRLWLQAAAMTRPEIDLGAGVGIHGGSAGGQSALSALLHHGDFYTVAVADAGCHDKIKIEFKWMDVRPVFLDRTAAPPESVTPTPRASPPQNWTHRFASTFDPQSLIRRLFFFAVCPMSTF